MRQCVCMTPTTVENSYQSVPLIAHQASVDAALARFKELIQRFGFFPSESIVVSWRSQGVEILAQRSNLPEVGEFDRWIEHFLEPLETYSPDSADIFVHSIGEKRAVQEFIQGFVRTLHEREIFSPLQVHLDDLYAFVQHCDENCSPHVWDLDAENPLPSSRVELAQEFDYDPNVGISRKVRRNARRRFDPENARWRSHHIDFILEFLENGEAISESDVARVATGCMDHRVRDVILWHLAKGEIKDLVVAERLSDLLPHLRGRWVAPIASMAAITWWVSGNGAKANICVERALDADPGYSLATLVRAALIHGVPASFWVETVSELSRSDCFDGEHADKAHGVPVAQ